MAEFADKGKGKRYIGPHIVVPERSPIRISDKVNDIHGEFEYQWVCKYCGEKEVRTDKFTRHSCDGFAWLDSERIDTEDD